VSRAELTSDVEVGDGISIGALSKATGIPVATIRSWERRYGFPEAARLASGHRRYDLTQVERLRRMRHAVELGHRASDVVGASDDALASLIEASRPAVSSGAGGDRVAALLAATRELDARALDRGLRLALDGQGLRRFVHETVVPFLQALGEAWASGRLGVMHEHFASARVRQLLAERRRAYEEGEATVVCAALPGEQHDLGLQVASLLLAFAGAHVVFLGADTPPEDIGAAALQSAARGVLVGSSPSARVDVALSQLGALRRLLGPEVGVAVGGLGSAPPGVTLLSDFEAVERWWEELAA